MIDPKLNEFLLEKVRVHQINHSGRTLYAHLCGTHDLLKDWGNPQVVCNGGLFHSIYGTKQFRHKTWPITDRLGIRLLIGPLAEFLVYAFATADRPKAWFAPYATTHAYKALREIEAANLIEQGSKSKWLRDLLDSDISEKAKEAINVHLKVAA